METSNQDKKICELAKKREHQSQFTNIDYSKPIKWRIHDGYAELLDRYPWEWFINLTFEDAIHPEAAFKQFKKWVSIINTDLFGRKWRKKKPFGIYWALATEYQKRDVLHYHGVISGVKDIRRLTYMDTWHQMPGNTGYSRIYAVESQSGVCRYITKYVTKGGEIEFSPNLPDLTKGFETIWHGTSQEVPNSESINPPS